MVRAIEVARKSIFMFIHIIHQQRYMLPVSPSLSRTYFIATANSVWRESQDTVLDALTAGLLDCIFRFTHHVHSSSRILLVHMYLRKMLRTGTESDEKPRTGTESEQKQMRSRSRNAIPAKHFGTHGDQSRSIITLSQTATTWLIQG
jgi:hypothetical protein